MHGVSVETCEKNALGTIPRFPIQGQVFSIPFPKIFIKLAVA